MDLGDCTLEKDAGRRGSPRIKSSPKADTAFKTSSEVEVERPKGEYVGVAPTLVPLVALSTNMEDRTLEMVVKMSVGKDEEGDRGVEVGRINLGEERRAEYIGD